MFVCEDCLFRFLIERLQYLKKVNSTNYKFLTSTRSRAAHKVFFQGVLALKTPTFRRGGPNTCSGGSGVLPRENFEKFGHPANVRPWPEAFKYPWLYQVNNLSACEGKWHYIEEDTGEQSNQWLDNWWCLFEPSIRIHKVVDRVGKLNIKCPCYL